MQPTVLYRRTESPQLSPEQAYRRLNPEQALQPREYGSQQQAQPLGYTEATPRLQAIEGVPATEQPRQYLEARQGTPVQPREYSQGVPATEEPRQYYTAQQGTPVTEPRLYEGTQETPRLYEGTESTPVVYGRTQPLLYEGTPEVYGQTLQPREYDREIPATEDGTVEEQPLRREQAFPRIEAQPVQDPNQA